MQCKLGLGLSIVWLVSGKGDVIFLGALNVLV